MNGFFLFVGIVTTFILGASFVIAVIFWTCKFIDDVKDYKAAKDLAEELEYITTQKEDYKRMYKEKEAELEALKNGGPYR